MLSSITKSVNSVYKTSKRAVLKVANNQLINKNDFNSKALVVLVELIKSKKQILSTKKMGYLATLSFDMPEFDTVNHKIFMDLVLNEDLTLLYQDNNINNKRLRYRRNLLVICGYLVKHGPSGFIDQFRDQIIIFQHYTNEAMLPVNNKYSWQIRSRAQYIVTLLKDKNKMLRQKQLAMLVRQKMKMYQQIHGSDENKSEVGNRFEDQTKTSQKEKVQNFLQNYLFHFAYKIDEKLDNLAQILATQVEKYLLEEMPQSFQIQQAEQLQGPQIKTQLDISQQIAKKQQQFITQKNRLNVQTKNLLDM